MLATVVSHDEPAGTSILLEPCLGSFVGPFQKSAFKANLPVMVFGAKNVAVELSRLKVAGVKVRPDLNKPEWGLVNIFEDGCGNFLMIEGSSD